MRNVLKQAARQYVQYKKSASAVNRIQVVARQTLYVMRRHHDDQSCEQVGLERQFERAKKKSRNIEDFSHQRDSSILR
jgi:hypothetical protein